MPDKNFSKIFDRIIGKVKKNVKVDQSSSTNPSKSESVNSSNNSSDGTQNNYPRVYLKALNPTSLKETDEIKREIELGNILIIRIDHLAKKKMEDVKHLVGDLCEFIKRINGDIARLGEERIVVTPSFVRIWKEKTTMSDVHQSIEA